MVSGIYAITNKANGKIYVGQSNNINRRYREHFSMLRHNHKYKMFRNNREPNPIGCFGLKYNGKSVNVGCFMDFVTHTLLNDFIKENDMDGSV